MCVRGQNPFSEAGAVEQQTTFQHVHLKKHLKKHLNLASSFQCKGIHIVRIDKEEWDSKQTYAEISVKTFFVIHNP